LFLGEKIKFGKTSKWPAPAKYKKGNLKLLPIAWENDLSEPEKFGSLL